MAQLKDPRPVNPPDIGLRLLDSLSKQELIAIIVDDAKNWLAHDGLWFQAVEASHGMAAAIDADRAAWEKFTVIEAKRIMARLGLQPGGGIPALVECLVDGLISLGKQFPGQAAEICVTGRKPA